MKYLKKINIIRNFLQALFQNNEVFDTYDSDRFAQTFRIKYEHKICSIAIRRSFIDKYKEDEISDILKKMNVQNYFQNKATKRVTIGLSKITFEDE